MLAVWSTYRSTFSENRVSIIVDLINQSARFEKWSKLVCNQVNKILQWSNYHLVFLTSFNTSLEGARNLMFDSTNWHLTAWLSDSSMRCCLIEKGMKSKKKSFALWSQCLSEKNRLIWYDSSLNKKTVVFVCGFLFWQLEIDVWEFVLFGSSNRDKIFTIVLLLTMLYFHVQ